MSTPSSTRLRTRSWGSTPSSTPITPTIAPTQPTAIPSSYYSSGPHFHAVVTHPSSAASSALSSAAAPPPQKTIFSSDANVSVVHLDRLGPGRMGVINVVQRREESEDDGEYRSASRNALWQQHHLYKRDNTIKHPSDAWSESVTTPPSSTVPSTARTSPIVSPANKTRVQLAKLPPRMYDKEMPEFPLHRFPNSSGTRNFVQLAEHSAARHRWSVFMRWRRYARYDKRALSRCAVVRLSSHHWTMMRAYQALSRYVLWSRRRRLQTQILVDIRCEASMELMRAYFNTMRFLPAWARLRNVALVRNEAAGREIFHRYFRRWYARAERTLTLPKKIEYLDFIFARTETWLMLVRFRAWVRWLTRRRFYSLQLQRMKPLMKATDYGMRKLFFQRWGAFTRWRLMRCQQEMMSCGLHSAVTSHLCLRYFMMWFRYSVRHRLATQTVHALEAKNLSLVARSFWCRWGVRTARRATQRRAVRQLEHVRKMELLYRYLILGLGRWRSWRCDYRIARRKASCFLALYSQTLRRRVFAALRQMAERRARLWHCHGRVVSMEQFNLACLAHQSYVWWLKVTTHALHRRQRQDNVLHVVTTGALEDFEHRWLCRFVWSYFFKWYSATVVRGRFPPPSKPARQQQ